MKRAWLLLLGSGCVLGCAVPTDALVLKVRVDDEGVLEGFGCQTRTETGDVEPLANRLSIASPHLYLVMDVIRVAGPRPSGPGSLLDRCNPHVRDPSQPVPSADARACTLAPEARTCVDVDATELVSSDTPGAINRRQLSVNVLRELSRVDALVRLDEPGPVMFRVVGTLQRPSGCARSWVVKVTPEGELLPESRAPSDSPEPPAPFLDEALIGCAFSMPTTIGRGDQVVELGLEFNALMSECTEAEVVVCANELTP